MDAATNVASATGAYADIHGSDSVTGSGASSDTLTVTTAAGALSFAATQTSINGFEKLVLANGTNVVTMDAAMQDSVAGVVAPSAAGVNSFHTVTGGTGYDTIVLATANNTVNLSTVTGIEQFTATALTADTLAFTGAAATSYITDQSAGGNTITVGNFVGNNISVAQNTAAGATLTVNGGNQIDTVTVVGNNGVYTTATGVFGAGGITTNFEVINTAAVVGTVAGVNTTGSLVTLSGTNTQTVNVNGNASVVVDATATGNKVVNLTNGATAGADVVTSIAGYDVSSAVAGTKFLTVNNFNANATDFINFAGTTAATALFEVTVSAFDSSFVTNVNQALANNAAYKAQAAGTADNVIIVNVGSDKYAVLHNAAWAATGAVAATDEIVKLTGTITGTLDAADFI